MVWHKERKYFEILSLDGALLVITQIDSAAGDSGIPIRWLIRQLQVKPTVVFNVHDCIGFLLKK